MRKIYIPILAIFLLFIISCAEKINIYENGELKETLSWDTLYDVSCLLYTSPSPRDGLLSRMPSSA